MIKDLEKGEWFEINADGGLKQMLLPKKSEEESKVRNQDASIDNEWATWFVDLSKEQMI
jgi:hypothetical protein